MVNPIFIPFAGSGAILEASGVTIEKKILKHRKINFKSFIVWHFFTIIFAMIFFVWFFWDMHPAALELKNIIILIGIIISSIIANVFAYYAIKWEKITKLEPLRLFQPLFVVGLAFLMYASERQTPWGILAAAFIASLTLIFSHIKKHHIRFNKYMISALLGSFFFALELALAGSILDFYNPITFYFIRSTLVFLAVLAIFRSKPTSIDKKSWLYLFVLGAIWALYRILLYFGFISYGIIFTTLLFILAHVLIYIFAIIFLKEKLTRRETIAAAIILACVAYAVIIG